MTSKQSYWVWMMSLAVSTLFAQDPLPHEKMEFQAVMREQADAMERARLADSLISSKEAEGNPLDARVRRHLLNALKKESAAQLEERRQTGNLRIETNALGDNKSDMTYTTFTEPCRVLDTRLIPGGKLAPGQEYVYRVMGTNLASQGGNPNGCGVPLEATAVNINFVAVAPEGGGNLKGAAYLSPIPATGSILNYQLLSPALNIANGLLFPICDFWSTPFDCYADIKLQANGAATHVVADVIGYASRFPEEEVRGLVFERWNNGTTYFAGNTCINYGDAQGILRFYPPVSGKVWVRGTVQLRVHQNSPCNDAESAGYVIYLVSRTGGAPQCSDAQHRTSASLWWLKCGTTLVDVPLDGVFPAPAGTEFGITIDGIEFPTQGDSGEFWYSELTAQFIPD